MLITSVLNNEAKRNETTSTDTVDKNGIVVESTPADQD